MSALDYSVRRALDRVLDLVVDEGTRAGKAYLEVVRRSCAHANAKTIIGDDGASIRVCARCFRIIVHNIEMP